MTEGTQREGWASRLDYFLACIGSTVGLGNMWRFPYLCYKNGGGAFLLPYIVCVLAIGIPIQFLESAMGQYTRRGVFDAFNICPLMRGIGMTTTVYGLLMSVYYNIIMAWVGYYLFVSFYSDLPWARCGHPWNSDNCVEGLTNDVNATSSVVTLNGNTTTTRVNYTVNATANATSAGLAGMDPASEYWWRGALELSDGIETPGSVCLHLMASLAVVWLVTYFCLWKGIRWSGKIVYLTATIPYILMLVMLIRSSIQEGAGQGVVFYLKPRFEELANAQVWFEAASQVLFSYTVAQGVWHAFGSYCPFNNNCYRYTLLIAVCNSMTSFLSGFVIFTMLGHMAHVLQQPINTVATSGPGLAFIVYPRAVTLLPLPQAWSVLSFTTLILLGIDSQVGTVEGVLTSLLDAIPKSLKRRELLLAGYSCAAFLLGLTMVTQGGMYVFQWVDYYLFGAFIPQVISLLQVITVAWLYGANQFYDNISSMLGYRLGPWMKISWFVITPLSLLIIMGFQLATFKPLTYNKTYVYPGWANTLGYVMTAAVISFIPAYAIRALYRASGGLRERFIETTRSRIAPSVVPVYEQEMTTNPVPDEEKPLKV